MFYDAKAIHAEEILPSYYKVENYFANNKHLKLQFVSFFQLEFLYIYLRAGEQDIDVQSGTKMYCSKTAKRVCIMYYHSVTIRQHRKL